MSGVVLPAGIEAVSIGSVGSDTDWGEALGDIDTVVHCFQMGGGTGFKRYCREERS